MPLFAYRAVNAAGREFSGTIEAPQLSVLLGQLAEKDLVPVAVSEETRAAPREAWLPFGRSVRRAELANFSDHLGAMLSAGLPLIEALETLAQQAEAPALASVARDLARAVRDGRSLSDALAGHPAVFSDLYVSMVRAGEESGRLAEILEGNAQYLEKEAELAGKVRDALVYPAIVAAVAVVVVTGMLVFIIPRFVGLLENVGAQIPWPTKVLMTVSRVLVTRWYVVLGALAGAGVAARSAVARPEVRLWIDQRKLALPVAGPLFLRASVARFARTLGSLLGAGVPILHALDLTRKVLGNAYLDGVVGAAAQEIRDGASITGPLRRAEAFPPMVIQMIHVGESSGSLERMLARVGSIYEKEVDRAARRLAVVLEPAMIVGIGLFVSFVALALLLPMVKAIGTLGKG